MLSFAFLNVSDGIVVKTDKIEVIAIKKIISVFVTTYKYNKNTERTADGSVIKPGVLWCAVSPDMLKDHNLSFGDTMFYKEVGYAIHDLTNERLKKTVDILIHDNDIFAESSSIYITNPPNGN